MCQVLFTSKSLSLSTLCSGLNYIYANSYQIRCIDCLTRHGHCVIRGPLFACVAERSMLGGVSSKRTANQYCGLILTSASSCTTWIRLSIPCSFTGVLCRCTAHRLSPASADSGPIGRSSFFCFSSLRSPSFTSPTPALLYKMLLPSLFSHLHEKTSIHQLHLNSRIIAISICIASLQLIIIATRA